ncbi:glycosyltransferase family 39 protein, partial [Patescibacteria group bacterium]|nr:glycosyltransferase family 39 protein [Patescibacteria group bacterium]
MGTKKVIFLILLLGLILRLVAINQSLWLDEAIGAIAVRDFSYSGLITDFLKFDNHPPLYYLDLKTWTSVFGYSELALRFHSVLYGVLTVLVTYLIAKKLVGGKNKLFPILSSLLLATSQIHIYYSHEARMYSMVAFLASLAFYSFLFLIEKKNNKNYYWVLFSFSITSLVFTDYVPIFLLPV